MSSSSSPTISPTPPAVSRPALTSSAATRAASVSRASVSRASISRASISRALRRSATLGIAAGFLVALAIAAPGAAAARPLAAPGGQPPGHLRASAPGPAALTAPKLAPLLPHRITAIGDSLMIDYESPLEKDLPEVVVDAQVSRQFSTGIGVARALRAAHHLGSRVIVDLGTNGTVTATEFAEMLAALRGATRIVFVTVHVDQPWQAEVNAELRAGVAAHPKVTRLADWAALAAEHPGWFYSDGTHLPIGGPGAAALAALVAATMDKS